MTIIMLIVKIIIPNVKIIVKMMITIKRMIIKLKEAKWSNANDYSRKELISQFDNSPQFIRTKI